MKKIRNIPLNIQLDRFKKLFLEANVNPLTENPWDELKKIDWTIIKDNQSLSDNLHNLKNEYSNFNWDLYSSIDEMHIDEMPLNFFDAEVKLVVKKSGNSRIRRGIIRKTLPEWMVGKRIRCAVVETIDQYIRNWKMRVAGQEGINLKKEHLKEFEMTKLDNWE